MGVRMNTIAELFKKIGITPVKEITDSKLETMFLVIENKELNELSEIETKKENYILSLFSERTGGFHLEDWDLPGEDIEFTKELRESVIMYYKDRGEKGSIDFYIKRVETSLVDGFIKTKMFSYIEILDPVTALKWPFTDIKERAILVEKAVYQYARKIADEKGILASLYDELPRMVEKEMKLRKNN